MKYNIDTHNLYAIFVKFLEICKEYSVNLCGKIRAHIALQIDGGGNISYVDSKPLEVCKMARQEVKDVRWVKVTLLRLPIMDILHLRISITLDINYTL